MSTAAMQPAGQYAQVAMAEQYNQQPPSRYASQQNDETYYAEQSYDSSNDTRQSRRQDGHIESNNSAMSQPGYYNPQTSGHVRHESPRSHPSTSTTNYPPSSMATNLPTHTRNRSTAPDQYDGPPTIPSRASSQQQAMPQAPSTAPLEERVAASRYARQNTEASHGCSSQNHSYGGDYNEPVRERVRDDTATAAATAARTRRKGPASPEGPHRAASTRERNQPPAVPQKTRSEATMVNTTAPAPLIRENSDVINRVIVSDPQVDAERLQERVAEAQPMPIGSDVTLVTGLGLVGSEGVEDGGRGAQRRQEFPKTSRRKDLQLGEYMLGQTLGEGEFGKVKLGWKKDGSSQVAIKLIRRESVATNPSRLPKIYREISILRDLAHPNIVRLHEMVETERHIGIILEYASGGELFDYILNNRYLKDPAARRLFAQLVSGVGYLHKKGIVHRDLKLENLLLDQNKNIIITDFGFANTFNPVDELSDEVEYNLGNKEFVRKYRLDRQDERGMRKGDLMQTSCGSPCYAAPELVVSDSLYTGRKVDVWSCGVILYAMLAGYLPFDDDPANPDGDNINLLYKYITTTPLTFPEYVSPHARDLLRRILVPDPRKRADLFEVARHSWLSEYHHVVSHITSSTTNIADIANSTVPSESHESPILNRSASVREPSRPVGGTPKISPAQQHRYVTSQDIEVPSTSKQKATRHTLQPEYVEPQTHTIRGPAPVAAAAQSVPIRSKGDSQGKILATTDETKPLPQVPMGSPSPEEFAAAAAMQQSMAPPVRPARDVPRSVSDSAGAFATVPAQHQSNTQQITRPSTGASLTSANGLAGTRSDLRLPSRGSYGQPVAPTVATTNAQGRVTQPSKSTRGYNISGPIPQHSAHASIGQPMTQSMGTNFHGGPAMPPPQPGKGHHRRTSTLSGLGERLFGRTGSVMRKRDSEGSKQRNGKKYPPTAMKEPFATTDTSRPSIDSKRSFSFGLGKKKSVDLESQSEKPSRRFSLIPQSMSFKGLIGGGSRDQLIESRSPQTPQTGDFPRPPTTRVQSRPETESSTYQQYAPNLAAMGSDGQQEQPRQKAPNFSRPPQSQQYQQHRPPSSQPSNDVYGGTAVYTPPSQAQYYERNYQQEPFHPQYPEGFGDQPRQSMQQARQGRGVLVKPNRNFRDGYENDHQSGSSGAVKKVQDFFRRRGRARVDGDYR